MKTSSRILLTMIFALIPGLYALAQTVGVKGKVVDANDQPLIGVAVYIEGTNVGTVTDMDGLWSMDGLDSGTVLTFSSLGYITRQVAVGQQTEINIVLQEEVMDELSEVMVVAYGTAKKSSFTGSAATVKGSDLNKRVTGNLTKSIEGMVPGLQVTSGGGQPGEGASIMIRGIGSINAVSTPLYVVDGIPYDGSLSAINPSDIESMTVLKDASAGALYGARGANGVIVITTKKGKGESASVSYKGSAGVASRALKRYDLVGMSDYVELAYEALRNNAMYGIGMDAQGAAGYAATNLGQTIGGLKNPEYYNPYKNYTWETLIDSETGKIHQDATAAWNENWMDEISNDAAFRSEHMFSVNGSSEKSNYLVSAGYYTEDGILQNTNFDRYTGRVNLDSQVKDWMKVGMSANYSHTNADYQNFSGSSTSNVWYTAQFMAPVYPVYLKDMAGENVLDENGNLQYEYGAEDDNSYANRPVAQGFNSKAELYNNKAYYTRNTLSTRSYLTLGTITEESPLYGLKFSLNMGVDFNDYQRTIVNDKYHGNAAAQGGRLSKTNTRTLSYTFNQILNYDKTIAGDHDIKVLLGHEFYRYNYNYAYGEKTGIMDGIDELAPAVTTSDNNSYSHNYAIESYFTRLNYGFKDRYYFDASWRTDGSSRFHKDHRWGNFWSVGASWRISQESFMQAASSWLGNLTLKASYGVQGNDNLGTYYAWQGLYNYTWANGSEAGAFASKLENRAVTWEKNGNLNIGAEASLFKGKLSVTAEYYNRHTRDMLLSSPLPISTGFTGFDDNVGSMRNQGFELAARYNVIARENFRWDLNFMASFNRNKVTSLTSSQEFISAGASVIEVGKPIYTFYISKTAGVDPATGKQLYYAHWKRGVDENGTLTNVRCEEYITDNTSMASMSKYYMGSREPLVSGSFGSSFELFKSVDISFLTAWSIGGKVYDGLYSGTMNVQSVGNNWHKNVLRRWQKPGDITDVPRVEIGAIQPSSDVALIDASYLGIKNVTVGYTFASKWISKLNISALRLFVTADNIAMFTHLPGMDPQYNFSGSVSYSYTPSKAIVAGIDLRF